MDVDQKVDLLDYEQLCQKAEKGYREVFYFIMGRLEDPNHKTESADSALKKMEKKCLEFKCPEDTFALIDNFLVLHAVVEVRRTVKCLADAMTFLEQKIAEVNLGKNAFCPDGVKVLEEAMEEPPLD